MLSIPDLSAASNASSGFPSLLQTLGLIQGSFKPYPTSNQTSYAAMNITDVPLIQAVDFTNQASFSNNDACFVEPYTSPYNAVEPFPTYDPVQATIYRYRQQQSVNLGSWFVQEQWMTPSTFACASGKKISELDIASGWGSHDDARAVLEKHWDTFISESDFQYLTTIGINTVRLPIGYWSLGPSFCAGTPFEPVADVYQNAWAHVVHAINIAGKAGISVLVDLHGAPGSQNGQPHSGISDGATNLFTSSEDQDKTVSVLVWLAQQLVHVTNVIGIQMLNEPQNAPNLSDFYARALDAMRGTSPEAASFPIYLHDGFDLNRFADFIGARTDFVVQDYHSYFVFTPQDDAEAVHDHTSDIQSYIANSLGQASQKERRNLIIGEWSCALTPNSLAKETSPQDAQKQFCTDQMYVYMNATAGSSFWSYTKEDCENDPGWCFKTAVGRNLPSTFFSYGQGPLTSPSQLQEIAALTADFSSAGASSVSPSKRDPNTQAAFVAPPEPLQASFSASSSSSFAPLANGTPGLLASSAQYPSTAATAPSKVEERDDVTDIPNTQRSISKGYSDGWLTAQIFATHGLSRLGFIGQYMADSIERLGTTIIAPGTENDYKDWFLQGLCDGENIVRKAINV